MSEGPAFHPLCGGRLTFSTDAIGNACERCEKCGYGGYVGRRDPTPDDNNGKGRHHGQGVHPKRGIGRRWPTKPPKEPT